MLSARHVPTSHDLAFDGVPLQFLGVEPVVDFDATKLARTGGQIDKTTTIQARDEFGIPLWHVRVFDPDGEDGACELKVKIPLPVQPVIEHLAGVVFEGLSLSFWAQAGASFGDKQGRPKVKYSVSATNVKAVSAAD